MSSDEDRKARLPYGGKNRLLELPSPYPGNADAWEALPVAEQERVIGRTKQDSIELDDKPADAHVASTDQERFGDIFRRNMPYGTVTDHGTMFVGFCATQRPLAEMLESMAGLVSGTPDALSHRCTVSSASPGWIDAGVSGKSYRVRAVSTSGVASDWSPIVTIGA